MLLEEKDEVRLWLLPRKEKWELQGQLLLLGGPAPSRPVQSFLCNPLSLHARHPELNVDAIGDQSSVQANGPAARDAPLPPQ